MSGLLKVTFILFSFSLIHPSWGDDMLDVIEVQARKNIDDFGLGSAETLTEEEINSAPTSLISGLLSASPGIIANQNGGPGGRVSLFIRGTESRHVAFTLDGLKLNDSSNNDRQFDSAFLTSSFIKSMTLHKGPQAVLYGSDALGGLVEMKTRKGGDAPQTRLILNAGSFGTVDASLSSDWRDDNHQGTFTWSQFRTDGISRLNKKRFGATERDASDVTQVTSSFRHTWSDLLQTDFLGSFLIGRNELDGFTDDNSHDESTNTQYIFQQQTFLGLNDQSGFSLRNGLNRHQRSIDTLVVGQESYEGDLIQHELLFRQEAGKLSFLAGISLEIEQFEVPQVTRDFTLNSHFLQTAVKMNPLTLEGGIREETHSRYGNFFTGSAGISLKRKNQTVSLQHSQGFKAPSLYQLYAPPTFGSPIGNTELRPEVNKSWEASWQWKRDDQEAEVTFFQNNLSNLISFTSQGFINQGSFTTQGVEVQGKLQGENSQLIPSFIHQQFSHQQGPILRRPYNAAQLNWLCYLTQDLEGSAKAKWFDSRKDLDQQGRVVKLNGFSTLDLGLKYFQGKSDYGIQLLNIFDRSYEEVYGFSVMPRAVYGHYGYRF